MVIPAPRCPIKLVVGTLISETYDNQNATLKQCGQLADLDRKCPEVFAQLRRGPSQCNTQTNVPHITEVQIRSSRKIRSRDPDFADRKTFSWMLNENHAHALMPIIRQYERGAAYQRVTCVVSNSKKQLAELINAPSSFLGVDSSYEIVSIPMRRKAHTSSARSSVAERRNDSNRIGSDEHEILVWYARSVRDPFLVPIHDKVRTVS